MTKPLVSVITPAYNSGKYIAETINSVTAQSYGNWELIIADDASRDDTAEIVKAFAEKEPRVKYVRSAQNGGAAKARNKAIASASGEWLAFLDSDDKWTSDKLEKQLKFARAKNADFTFTASSFMDEEGRPYSWTMKVPEEVDYKTLLRHNVISCSSVMITKERLDGHSMRDAPKIHEDFALWLEILKDGGKARGLNEPLLIYRVLKNSKSGNKIKSLAMTYGTYKAIGLGAYEALYNTARHTANAAMKYTNLYKKGVKEIKR